MTNSEARKRITGTTDDWHTCDRAEQAEATIARIQALMDEWDTVGLGSAPGHYGHAEAFAWWHVWEDAADQVRAALEDQP